MTTTAKGKSFPSNRFCLIHVGRCGSTVLTSMLQENPFIECHGEILTTNRPIYPYSTTSPELEFRRRKTIRKKRFLDYLDWCAELRFVQNEGSIRETGIENVHYGFEIKFHQIKRINQMKLGRFVSFLQLNDIVPIFLYRKNALKRIVSVAAGRTDGKWHAKPGDDYKAPKLTLKPDRVFDLASATEPDQKNTLTLKAALRRNRQLRRKIETLAANRDIPILYYEDFEFDPMIGVTRISEIIGISPHATTPPFLRTASAKLEDQLENFDEIKEVLAETDFKWMLS